MARHIVYVIPYLEAAGTERHVLALAQHFNEGDRVTLLAPDGRGSAMFADAGIRHLDFPRLDFGLVAGSRGLQARLKQAGEIAPVDIVHVHGGHELLFFARRALPNARRVFTVHGYHGRSAPSSFFFSSLFIRLYAQKAITVCESDRSELLSWHAPGSRLTTVWNGVREPQRLARRQSELAARFGLQPGEDILIGTAARLDPAKGLDTLISAFSAAAAGRPRLKLVIAGSGALEGELRAQAAASPLRDRIILTGYLDAATDLIGMLDIFAQPSRHEAMSLAFLEAMALGVPAIGTDVGGIPDQIVDGGTGYVVAKDDVAGLAARIAELSDDPAKRERMGQAGRSRYLAHFTETAMLEHTDAVYRSVMV